MVFVISSNGAPLDPCHEARARELLKKGRAAVWRMFPLTIKLKDRTRAESVVATHCLKLDPGSKTTGIDYDLSVRLPASSLGKFTVKFDGTRTLRYDRQVLATSPIDRMVGTTLSDVPRNKFNLSLNFKRDDWSGFVRLSHTDALERTGFTSTCESSSSASNP